MVTRKKLHENVYFGTSIHQDISINPIENRSNLIIQQATEDGKKAWQRICQSEISLCHMNNPNISQAGLEEWKNVSQWGVSQGWYKSYMK